MNYLPDFDNRLTDEEREAELMIIEIAARIQLSPTQVKTAEQNYEALADYIDAPGSQLEDSIRNVHPSGSFSIQAPIVGQFKDTQHDVDGVLELIGHEYADPEEVLIKVEDALNRPDKEGKTRYQGMVNRQSRCVTVTYKDGRTVDLMPVFDLYGQDDPRKSLFHFKEGKTGQLAQSYHKRVGPRLFKSWYLGEEAKLISDPMVLREYFNDTLQKTWSSRQVLLEKAETEPLPEQKPIKEKSVRTLSVQLLKRNRDIHYHRTTYRKPPSVLIATLGMQSGFRTKSLLIDELIAVAGHIRNVLAKNIRASVELDVRNPGYTEDLISDRWRGVHDQSVYTRSLDALISDLDLLKREPRLSERRKILAKHFGENVSAGVLQKLEESRSNARAAGRTRVGRNGGIITSASTGIAASVKKTPYGSGLRQPSKKKTPFGG